MADHARSFGEDARLRADLLGALAAHPQRLGAQPREDDILVWPLDCTPGAGREMYAFLRPEAHRIVTATCLCPLLEEEVARDVLERSQRYLMVGVWRHRVTAQQRTLLRLYFLVPDTDDCREGHHPEDPVLENLTWLFAQAEAVRRLSDDGHMLG